MSFTDYWEQRKEVFEKLGVSKEVAKMIWCDCADAFAKAVLQKTIEKYLQD